MEHQLKAKYQRSQMQQWEMLMDSAQSLGGVKEIPVPSPPCCASYLLSLKLFFPLLCFEHSLLPGFHWLAV